MAYELSDKFDRNSSDKGSAHSGVTAAAREAYEPGSGGMSWNVHRHDSSSSELPPFSLSNSGAENSTMQNGGLAGQTSAAVGTMDAQSGIGQQNVPAELQQLETGIQNQLAALSQEVTQLQSLLGINSQAPETSASSTSPAGDTASGVTDTTPPSAASLAPMESAPTPQASALGGDIAATETSTTASLPAGVASLSSAASPSAEVADPSPVAANPPAEAAGSSPAAASPPAEVAPQAQTTPANVQAVTTANTPASTAATSAVGDGSGFQTTNGQLTYNGKLLSGVAVTGQYVEQVGAQQAAATIKADFPNINVVRLATSPDGGAFSQGNSISGGESVADIDAAIQAFNAQGIGVIVDNHGADSSTADNVSQDGGEPAWFGQLASDNQNNNNVMFQTQNEPTGGDGGADVNSIVQEQQAAYDAIRANGFNGVVAFEAGGGNWSGPFTSAPSTYDGDSNYVIDFHQYPGGQTSVQSFQSDISSSITEANGSAVPVYIGETGITSASQTPNAADTSSLQSAFTDGTGAVTWLFDGSATGFNDANHLTNADGTLTGYGQTVAGLIQQGAS